MARKTKATDNLGQRLYRPAERLDSSVQCAKIMWLVSHSQHDEWKFRSTIQHKVCMRCIIYVAQHKAGMHDINLTETCMHEYF